MKKMKHNVHFRKCTMTITVLLLFFAGCRKLDNIQPFKNENYEEIRSNFFKINATEDIEIKKLAEDFKKQDSILKFLPQFIRKNGIPKWDKVIYKTFKNSKLPEGQKISEATDSATILSNRTASTSNNKDQGVFFIPLQSQNSQEVKSYITVYKHNDSLYSYRLYNKDSLNTIQALSNSSKNNLLNTLAVFGYFEKSINDIDSVNIKSPFNGTIKNAKIRFENAYPSSSNNVILNSIVSTGYCTTTIYITIEYSLEIWTDSNSIWLVESLTVSMEITIDCYGGGGGGGCSCGDSTGGGSYYDPSGSGYWWNYGTGWPWNIGNGGNYNSNWYWWWTSGGGYGGSTSSGFSPYVSNLSTQLALNYVQSLWLENNPQRTIEINNFINTAIYSDLSFNDKTELALSHLNNMMTDLEYLEMVDSYSASTSFGHPWMIELFKEFALEIGLKVIKKYLPGYGDWQSIKDAIDNAGHGDWLGTLGEVLNIVKKKVPWLAGVDAIIDVFDFGKLANKAWKAFDKIKDLPPTAFNSLLKTIKQKCGDILGKIEHDNNIQGIIKYDPIDAENFFRDFASNVGVGVNSTSTPGVFYFDIGNPPNNIRFTYYPLSTSGGDPSISITFPGGSEYKFRFRQ